MAVLGRAAEARIGRPLRDLELAEVYSCFPAAVRVQQRELGLDLSGTPTVTGGMAFAGGPFNHFVLLSPWRSAACCGSGPTSWGWSRRCRACSPSRDWPCGAPPRRRPRRAPRRRPGGRGRGGHRAGAGGGPGPVEAAATVVSFTVTYGRRAGLEPVRTAIVADLPDGVRTAATCEDADIARLAVAEGLIGRAIHVKDTTFSL